MKNKSISSSTLYTQLYQECQAMAQYALASGKSIPEGVLQTIYESGFAEGIGTTDLSATSQNGSNKEDADIGGSLSKSPLANSQPLSFDITPLAKAHQQLVTIVQPAKPQALLLLANEKANARWWHILGATRVTRFLMIVAIFFLVVFIASSLDPNMTGQANISNGSGYVLLVNELFLLSAAGLGVTFAILFKINKAIANGTYDPKSEASYSVKIISGLISGLLLATLVPLPKGDNSLSDLFGEPLLALLGGFSSGLLFQILNYLLKSVESLVTTTGEGQADAQKQLISLHTKEALAQERLSLASKLIKAQQDTTDSAGKDMLKQAMNDLLGDETVFPTNNNSSVAPKTSAMASTASG